MSNGVEQQKTISQSNLGEPKNELSTNSYQLDYVNRIDVFKDDQSLGKLLEFFHSLTKDHETLKEADLIFDFTEESKELENLSEFKDFYNTFTYFTYCDQPFPPEIAFVRQGENYIGFLRYSPIRYDTVFEHDKYPWPNNPGGTFSLYLLPEFRRHGLGTRITLDFIESKKNKADEIFFNVSNNNQSGQETFSKLPGIQLTDKNNIFTSYVIQFSSPEKRSQS